MKKIILIMALFLISMIGASAFVDYTGRPSAPYPIYGQVHLGKELVGGVKLTVTNENTNYKLDLVTNNEGYWTVDGASLLTTSGSRPPVMWGDTIKVTVQGDCASGEVCEKTFDVFSDGYENYAQIDFNFEKTSFPYLKESLLGALILVIVGLIGWKYPWLKGMFGIVKYYARIGKEKQSIKTLNTILKREKEGYYNKKK